MKPKERCVDCGQVKNGSNHVGETWAHDYEPPRKQSAWGSQRQPINQRSDRTRAYYESPGGRRDQVRAAVGDGRRPCQIKSPVCTGYVEGIHESAPRGRFGGLKAALESGPTFDACHACNRYCSENAVWASERGFLRSNKGSEARNTQPPRQAPSAPAQRRTTRRPPRFG